MADGASVPLPVPTGAAKTPSDFLKSIKGKPVLVKLNSGVDYRGASGLLLMQYSIRHTSLLTHRAATECARVCCCVLAGILACLDGYMNIAMEHTEVHKQQF